MFSLTWTEFRLRFIMLLFYFNFTSVSIPHTSNDKWEKLPFFFPLKEERAWSCQKFWVGLLSLYPFILSWMRKDYGSLHCCIRSEYLFITPYICLCREKRPCENTARNKPSISQGERPQEKSNLQTPDLEFLTSRIMRK